MRFIPLVLFTLFTIAVFILLVFYTTGLIAEKPMVERMKEKFKGSALSRAMKKSWYIRHAAGMNLFCVWVFLGKVFAEYAQDFRPARANPTFMECVTKDWKTWALTIILVTFVAPIGAHVLQVVSPGNRRAVREQKKQTLIMVAKSRTPLSKGAKMELEKIQAKETQSAMLKGALIGSAIGGDAGAVVGAMSEKAKMDAQHGKENSSL